MPFVVVITFKYNVISFCIQICLPHFWCHQDKSCMLCCCTQCGKYHAWVYVLNCWVRERKQNHDNGTVRHYLSHLNGTYEQYIGDSINHRHRVCCCINYVLVFDLFTIIFLLIKAPINFHGLIDRSMYNINRRNLVNFWPIETKLGSVFIKISRNIWYDR